MRLTVLLHVAVAHELISGVMTGKRSYASDNPLSKLEVHCTQECRKHIRARLPII